MITSDAYSHRPSPDVGFGMNRLLKIIYILFCFELGVCLFVFPWVTLWEKNFFVEHYPTVAWLSRNYFVRGAVSGLGLADIVLGFYEVLHFRRPRRARIRKGSESHQ